MGTQKPQFAEYERRMDYAPVRVDSDMEYLMEKAMRQNFVPVVDDQKNFIGIVTRRDIMQYICSSCGKEPKERQGFLELLQGSSIFCSISKTYG